VFEDDFSSLVGKRSVKQLQDQQRSELLELADQVKAEVDETAPDDTRLQKGFAALATAVDVVANAQPAYLVLKEVARFLGFPLP
jgi:hypothetical protein